MNKNINFINIGERTNVTGSALFKNLIMSEQYEEAVAVAKSQIDNGAQIIDINMDEGLLDSKKAMQIFVKICFPNAMFVLQDFINIWFDFYSLENFLIDVVVCIFSSIFI